MMEEMREGSNQFTIHAYPPVEASFGFAEMRWRFSGAASASLLLSNWERLSVGCLSVC
jgi:ribosome assembly protein 1